MIKEKHIVDRVYGNHQLARYIDVYEVTTDGCSSSPMSGYKGTEATLIDQPAWNEKFSSYSITGATLTGNNYVINNDVTAKANYETAKNVTLQTDGHGTIAANKMSGFIGDQVTLSNTAATNYSFSGYTITGATLTGNKFNFIGNDVIAKAWFTGYSGKNVSYTLRGVDTFTGNVNLNTNNVINFVPTTTEAAKSYSVTRTYNTATVPWTPIWNGTAVNLTFTDNLFPFNASHDVGIWSDVSSMTSYCNTYDYSYAYPYPYITAGKLKLPQGTSAVITAVTFETTGILSNVNSLPTIKVVINNQTYNGKSNHISNTAVFGTNGTQVLNSPIILTNTNPSLTIKLTGTAPQAVQTVSDIRSNNNCFWHGYISARV